VTAIRPLSWKDVVASNPWTDRATEFVTAAIVEAVPDVEGLEEAISRHVSGWMRQFAEAITSEADPEALPIPVGTAQLHTLLVQRGFRWPTVARILRIGQITSWEIWTKELACEIKDAEELAKALTESSIYVYKGTDRLVGRALEHFVDERERWIGSALAIRTEVIGQLLADPSAVDPQDASRRLSYELGRVHIGVLIATADDRGVPAIDILEDGAREIAAAIGSSGPLLHTIESGTVAAWLGMWEPPDPALLSSIRVDGIPSRFLVAVGSPGSGPAGFRRTHLQALRALRVARMLRRPPRNPVNHGDVEMLGLATADEEAALEFVKGQLGALAAGDDHTARLAATLRVYLENGASRRNTAQRLGIHENTVSMRLRAIEQMLGRSPTERIPETLLALALAASVGTEGEPSEGDEPG
jgi:hypothetical protein